MFVPLVQPTSLGLLWTVVSLIEASCVRTGVPVLLKCRTLVVILPWAA